MVWGFCYLSIFKKVQSISGRILLKEWAGYAFDDLERFLTMSAQHFD
jgi:hypothetical protein